jgi:hypothetical protein
MGGGGKITHKKNTTKNVGSAAGRSSSIIGRKYGEQVAIHFFGIKLAAKIKKIFEYTNF